MAKRTFMLLGFTIKRNKKGWFYRGRKKWVGPFKTEMEVREKVAKAMRRGSDA